MCGSMYVLVQLDDTNRIIETSEANNVAASPIKITCMKGERLCSHIYNTPRARHLIGSCLTSYHIGYKVL